MVKKITSLNIDSEIVKEAKRKGLNMSEVAEMALKEKTSPNKTKLDLEDTGICMDCRKKSLIKRYGEPVNGLLWLDNFQDWICPNCADARVRNIGVSQ